MIREAEDAAVGTLEGLAGLHDPLDPGLMAASLSCLAWLLGIQEGARAVSAFHAARESM